MGTDAKKTITATSAETTATAECGAAIEITPSAPEAMKATQKPLTATLSI